jgi:RNA polymerase-associated protein
MAQVTNRRLAMTLFSSDICPRCHTVRIVLAEKGINFDMQVVTEDNKPEDLFDLSPYGEVPTLVDRDLALYHHQVIVEYLDERFPHPPLMPVDPVSRGRNRLMLYRIERDWYSLADKIAAGSADVESARTDLRDGLLSVVPIFDQKPFFMSDEFSLMDCAIAPLLWRLPYYGIQLPGAAKPLINYSESMFERPSFQESLTEAEKEMRA